MSFFKPFTTRQLFNALETSITRYDEADEQWKEKQCDPDVPIVLVLGKNRYNVLSYGGDPNEPGLLIEIRPEKEFK